MKWIQPDAVFHHGQLHRDVALGIGDGGVVAMEHHPATPVAGIVVPGYVDLQVNGGGGVLLNTMPTVEGIAAIIAAHRSLGTAQIMPTLITDAPEVMEAATEAAIRAKGTTGYLGIHLEGPHLCLARRGTHAAQYVRPFDDRTMACLRRLRDADVPVMLTLAPDVVPPEVIARIAAIGVIVSLGHSDATAVQAITGFAAGARAVTHLYNAMSPLTHRAPGLVGAAMASDACVGIIADGIHVDDIAVGIACRARPVPDRMFIVSDAMPTVGGPETFDLYGQTIRVDHGRLVNAEGALAGAHTTMAEGVARLVTHVGLSLEQALRMAITVPAALVGRPDVDAVTGQDTQVLNLIDMTGRRLGALSKCVDL